jgi:hypothetical protein
VRSLRGDEVLVETRMLRDARAWRRLSPAADAIFADVLSEETVRKTKSRGLHPFRVLAEGYGSSDAEKNFVAAWKSVNLERFNIAWKPSGLGAGRLQHPPLQRRAPRWISYTN